MIQLANYRVGGRMKVTDGIGFSHEFRVNNYPKVISGLSVGLLFEKRDQHIARCAGKHCAAEDNHMVVSGFTQTATDFNRYTTHIVQHRGAVGSTRCAHTHQGSFSPRYEGQTLVPSTESSRFYRLAYQCVQLRLFDRTAASVNSLNFGQVWFYADNFVSQLSQTCSRHCSDVSKAPNYNSHLFPQKIERVN